MKLLEYLDRRDERKLEKLRLAPSRPRDNRMLVGSLFFLGYYAIVVILMLGKPIPTDNAALVKDALLVLGPIVGVIAQALFRTDVRDQIATENTAEFARATQAQAQATIAAAAATPTAQNGSESVLAAAEEVAQAANNKAEEIKDHVNEQNMDVSGQETR